MSRHIDWAGIGDFIGTHLPALWVVAAAVTGGLALSELVPDTPKSLADVGPEVAKITPEVIREFPLEIGTVTRVVDGDTYDVQLDRTGETVRVRLAWADAPESDQSFGPEATQWAEERLRGRQVVLTAQDVDRYGRMVAQVTVNGDRYIWDTAATLLRHGLAWIDPRSASEDYNLHEDQELAAAEGTGLWSDPGAVPPWEWRRDKKHDATETPVLLSQNPRQL